MTSNTAGLWLVRLEGLDEPFKLDSPVKVLEGLRDGDWEASDEVKGPTDTQWQAIETHPTFEDAVAEMGPPPPPPEDEARLDMNPLIDVALVLLIFFMLTTTYASMKRIISLPPTPPEKDAVAKKSDRNPLEDVVFRVKVTTDGADRVVIKLDEAPVELAKLTDAIKDVMRFSGKREMHLSVTDDVYWKDEAKVHDAAKGAGVQKIHMVAK